MPSFTIAIVGRPNVGKSTLFNRLLEQRKAIVDDISGVTRDRQYGIADWNGKTFNVIDTGGFVVGSDDVFEVEIRKQVEIALEEANLLLFVTDTTTGITHQDAAFTEVLRRGKKPVLLVVNKVDNSERALDATEFYSLGFEKIFMVSSISGSGTGELLDEVTEHITPEFEPALGARRKKKEVAEPVELDIDFDSEDFDALAFAETLDESVFGDDAKEEEKEEYLPKIAIIGQPNAGKSTLLNALIGQERTIVSDVPGTTRDAIHTHYNLFNKEFVLIDTAGLRKKKNVHEDLEFYSVIRAIKAMDEADICLLLVDATKGLTMQDINIYSLAARKGKGLVILVNKWDLVENKETNTPRDYERMIKEKIAPFNDVPILFISAKDKTRIFKAMEAAIKVYDNRRKKIQTSKLNEIMLKEIHHYAPPMMRGNHVRIKFCRQLPTYSPAFAFFANHPDSIKEPYRNFLENKIRSHFDFSGVPLRIFFRKK
jgi:GTP-binding protein